MVSAAARREGAGAVGGASTGATDPSFSACATISPRSRIIWYSACRARTSERARENSAPRWNRADGSLASAFAKIGAKSLGMPGSTFLSSGKSSWTILYEIEVTLSPRNGFFFVRSS